MIRHELFICRCDSTEHQLIFSYFDDDLNERFVYCNVNLIPEQNIWKRIKNGIKYIFGYKSKYGQFDEFIFKKEDVHKLEEIVKYLKGEI